jgi:D-arabinose 5-phosphate isomerase GutQ
VDLNYDNDNDDIVSGVNANLNAGAVLNPSIYLCMSRHAEIDPITDIVVIYTDKDEKCPPGYSMVKSSTASKTRSAQLCYTRSKARAPIVDIALVFPKHRERCPGRFVQCKKNINPGKFTDDLFICTRTSMLTDDSILSKIILIHYYQNIDFFVT